MKEMERLEELKKVVRNKAYYREGIPLEVIGIVRKAFEGMLNQYKQLHCDVSTIEAYMNGNLREVENYLTNDIGESRKEKQVEQLQNIFRRLEVELQDPEKQLDKKREEEHKEEILGIQWGDQEITNKTVEKLEDSLKNIRNTQKRILDSNGYSMDRITTIDGKVREYVEGSIKQNKNEIYELFQKDSRALKEQIVDEYGRYLLEQEQEQEENTKTMDSARNTFVDELDANISLEAQHDFAERTVAELEERAKQEEKSKDLSNTLPSDVII